MLGAWSLAQTYLAGVAAIVSESDYIFGVHATLTEVRTVLAYLSE